MVHKIFLLPSLNRSYLHLCRFCEQSYIKYTEAELGGAMEHEPGKNWVNVAVDLDPGIFNHFA